MSEEHNHYATAPSPERVLYARTVAGVVDTLARQGRVLVYDPTGKSIRKAVSVTSDGGKIQITLPQEISRYVCRRCDYVHEDESGRLGLCCPNDSSTLEEEKITV